jgi:hypothetical protein
MVESQNNAYFEQSLINQLNGMSEESLIQRISDCQMITEKLESDLVWKLVLKDAEAWVKRLDSTWQEIEDDKTRNYARVLKFAYLHIKELPNKYKLDFDNAKKALEVRRNTGSATPRDYDLETTLEK